MAMMQRCKEYTSVRGYLVKLAQTALDARGYDPSGIDGVFGPGTQRALKAWQKNQGDPASSAISAKHWELLTGLKAPGPFDLCVHLTAAFEGHDFTKVAGNFDRAYLTWGIIGFTMKSSLPGLLKEIDHHAGGEMKAIFGAAKYNSLMGILDASRAEKEAWGNSISIGTKKYRVRNDWTRAFRRLGELAIAQELQLQRAAKQYWPIALRDMKLFGGQDLNDMALFFDTAVQNGGVSRDEGKAINKAIKANPDTKGAKRRLIWAKAIADGSSTRYRKDVFSRKGTIARGEGMVHGGSYNLECWGIKAQPVLSDDLKNPEPLVKPRDFPETIGGITRPAIRTSTNWLEEIPVPAGYNTGLRSVNNRYMLSRLGNPRGDYGQDCRQPNNSRFRKLCDFNVALEPFEWKLWGLKAAVSSLKDVLADIEVKQPGIYGLLNHMGMGCCRFVRGSHSSISNHSFGSAIDLTIGGKLDPYNNDKIMRGMAEIIPIFNDHKWYSGAYFRKEDCMHLEISRNLFDSWFASGDLSSNGSAPDDKLSLGDRGQAVKRLQRKLNENGANVIVDGMFGPGTRAAIIAFQAANGLTPDGIVGDKTKAKLGL